MKTDNYYTQEQLDRAVEKAFNEGQEHGYLDGIHDVEEQVMNIFSNATDTENEIHSFQCQNGKGYVSKIKQGLLQEMMKGCKL